VYRSHAKCHNTQDTANSTHTVIMSLLWGCTSHKTGWTTHHIDQHLNGFEHMCILILTLYAGYMLATHIKILWYLQAI